MTKTIDQIKDKRLLQAKKCPRCQSKLYVVKQTLSVAKTLNHVSATLVCDDCGLRTVIYFNAHIIDHNTIES